MARCVFLFDFDDTLCCSTEVTSDSTERTSVAWNRMFVALQLRVLALLVACKQFGEVVIVSNASYCWTQKLLFVCMPTVFNFMSKHSISVVSARDDWGHIWPKEPIRWKVPSFYEAVDAFQADNIVVVGDGDPEMYAAKMLQKGYPHGHVKSVKFRSRPTVDDLMQQMDWVTNNAHKIVACDRSFFSLTPPAFAPVVAHVESIFTLPDDTFFFWLFAGIFIFMRSVYEVVQYVRVRSNMMYSALFSMLARLVFAVLDDVGAVAGWGHAIWACFVRFGTSLLCLKGLVRGSVFAVHLLDGVRLPPTSGRL